MFTNKPLNNQTVLVTRPIHQATKLCTLIEQAGAKALHVPVLKIIPLINNPSLVEAIKKLNEYDIAIFISLNAVEQAIAILKPNRFPPKLELAAIGPSSSDALSEAGYHNVTSPEYRFDSEGLLETPLFQNVDNASIALMRGQGGREWLGDTLLARGANVTCFDLYQRVLPAESSRPLQQALATGVVTLASITSNNGLENLMLLAGVQYLNHLQQLPLVVLSQRSHDFAQNNGFTGPIAIADSANDQAMVEAMISLI